MAKINVHLPAQWAPVGIVLPIPVEARTVIEAVEQIAHDHPPLRRHLFADDGSPRRFMRVFLRAQDIRMTGGWQTLLLEGDELTIVSPVAGG